MRGEGSAGVAGLMGLAVLPTGCVTPRGRVAEEARKAGDGLRGLSPSMAETAGEPLSLFVWVGAAVIVFGLLLFWAHKRAGLMTVLSGAACVLLGYILPALAPYALGGALIGCGMVAGYYIGRHNLITGEDSLEELREEARLRAKYGPEF